MALFTVVLSVANHARAAGSDLFDETDVPGVVIPYLLDRQLDELESADLPAAVLAYLALPSGERRGVTLIQVGVGLRANVTQLNDQLADDLVIIQIGENAEQDLILGDTQQNNQNHFFQFGQRAVDDEGRGARATIIEATPSEAEGIATAKGIDVPVYTFDNLATGWESLSIAYDANGMQLSYADGGFSVLGGDLQRGDLAAIGNIGSISQGLETGGIVTENGTVIQDVDVEQDSGTDTPQKALIAQTGTGSLAFISQAGSGNQSAILQNGDYNKAKAYQFSLDGEAASRDEFSLLVQVGDFNVASVYQFGPSQSSLLFQFGIGNTAVTEQRSAAGNGSAFIYQSSQPSAVNYDTGNYASLYQVASGS